MKCQHQHSPHLLCPQQQQGHPTASNHHQSYHHHHHHAHSFPSPSTPSVTAHHGQQQVAPACCGGAMAYPGSSTLPASPNPSADPTHCNYRTRTLPNLGPCGPTANYPCSQLICLSPCTIAFISLSLVFTLIWSSVISGVLVTHSLKEHETATNTAQLFELHQNVGQFAFEVGQEMLLMLNSSLSAMDQWKISRNESNHGHDSNATSHGSYSDRILDNVQHKWNSTDLTLEQVTANLAQKGYLDFESDVQNQLEKLRFKCAHKVVDLWPPPNAPFNASVALYPVLVDCVRAFQHSFHSLDTLLLKDTHWFADRQSKLALTDLVIRQMPYTLFVRGIVHRFTSLGLGLILVRSNFSHPFNMSEYFNYYFTSRQLIESSFVWNYRFLQKYLELERTDYQADMILHFFDDRRAQEHDFYLKMSSIFSRMFSIETLKRVRSYIKKKNVESVERQLETGNKTKYVADQEAHSMTIQLNTDLIETMGLDNIEQVMFSHDQMLSSPSLSSQWHNYDKLLRNQIGFMSRVQDFLNISISAHLAQASLNERHNLLVHSSVAAILILGVLFCLAIFLCTYCCSRPPTQCSHSQAAQTKSTFGRRMRRRLWNLSSPFSLFKSCFSAPFAPTSPPRYPLLYKSSHQNATTQYHPNSPMSSTRPCNTYCSSPNSFLVSGKRNLCGGIMNRYLASGPTSAGSSKTGNLSYKYEKPRNSNGVDRLTEATSLMADHSIPRAHASTSSSAVCCMSCSDPACGLEQVPPCDSSVPTDGCRQCAATGKCSTCCPFNRTETCPDDTQPASHKQRIHSKDSSKQSLHSSTLSVQSGSKNSSRSTAKEKEGSDNCHTELSESQ